jgi:hypothetical protein
LRTQDFESSGPNSELTAIEAVTNSDPVRGESHGEDLDSKPPASGLPDDPEFRALTGAWPTLPVALKAAVMALVNVATMEGK